MTYSMLVFVYDQHTTTSNKGIFIPRYSSNSEENENHEEMFPLYYMNSDIHVQILDHTIVCYSLRTG